jgi:hypothetical protein
MSMRRVRDWVVLGLLAGAAACAPQRRPPPPAPPQQQPRPPQPQPARPLPPPPPIADWRDVPLTPGGWVYRAEGAGPSAAFGQAAGGPAFTVRCDRAGRQVLLARGGGGPGNAITIRTSTLSRSLALSGGSAALPARDPLLDAIAFSRGRFTVEQAGLPMLVVPSWPEPARVIEDCRS